MFKKRQGRGKSAEKSTTKCKRLEEVVLPNSRLRFCPEQLQNLNFIFQKKLQARSTVLNDRSLLLARSVAERLVQRLICCAGMLDPRFSCKFLVATHNQLNNNLPAKRLEYLLRLDSLSTPQVYKEDPSCRYSVLETDPDYPAAYARIRLHTTTIKQWGDCANSGGYLRRDKIQAKLVELLARAAASEAPNSPLNVDESIHCATPGKIVDAFTVHEILKISPEKHVFYGPGGNVPRFPDPRDFRLAIVDEPSGIRLKIEFLSPALSNITIDVRLLVAVAIDFWPSSTDFPKRITMGHTDCLLYHQAAQTGMFLVGYGVQSSAWQIRLPAAQDVLLNHYSPTSTVRTILDILYDSLDEIDSHRELRKHNSYKILNRYILLNMLFKSLEAESSTPSADLINWSPTYLSTHILTILDKLINCLHRQNLANYFFTKSNLMVNPGHLCEDDYEAEAANVKWYIIKLFDEALMSTRGTEEFDKIMSLQDSESVLLYKWKELIEGLLPPISTRSRRFCFVGARNRQEVAHTEYTTRQMEYIGLLLENLLKVKQNILVNDMFMLESTIKVEDNHETNHLEDVIYLLVTIMDQARDKYFTDCSNPTLVKNRSKIKMQFNASTSKLIEHIRKDREMHNLTFETDLDLVKVILRWLYRALDEDKRHLAPILRPFLNNLFVTSHSLSWQLDFIKRRLNSDELQALGSFASLVNTSKITPAEGLIDAVNKNWLWAKAMLAMVQKQTLRVVFIQARKKVYRHILSLPSYQQKALEETGKSSDARKQHTLPANRNYFSTILKQGFEDFSEISPQHDILKNSSPLTRILKDKHRLGEHRGYGDILKSLQAMQKLSMFQQVTSNLPQEDRAEILETIHSLQNFKSKSAVSKRWSSTLPANNRRCKVMPKPEKYTLKEDSAGIRLTDIRLIKPDLAKDRGSLIESCRAARIREDNSVLMFQDSLKIKTLLNKSESFKL